MVEQLISERFTLKKEERLKSKKIIELLFKSAKRTRSKNMQLLHLSFEHRGTFLIQVGFSVPKRRVKSAVERNAIKRLMREVYRKHKYLIQKKLKTKKVYMFIYQGTKKPAYKEIENEMIEIYKQLKN